MNRGRSGAVEGWPIVGYSAALVAVMVLAILGTCGASEVALRAAIRATACTSLSFFLAAFIASSWNSLAPSPASKWLLRNRRYVGLSFAASQLGHALLIGALAHGYTSSFWSRAGASTLVGGGFGYVLIVLMVVTSFKGPAASIGRKAWTRLHTTGMYVFWTIFFASYAGRPGVYCFFTALLVGALGVRAMAARARAGRVRGVRA
jgi:hypothetical protein